MRQITQANTMIIAAVTASDAAMAAIVVGLTPVTATIPHTAMIVKAQRNQLLKLLQ